MAQEIKTKATKSFESNCHKFSTLAPKTFLTPISLVRCSATKLAKSENSQTRNKNSQY